MRMLPETLCLCLALALSHAAPTVHDGLRTGHEGHLYLSSTDSAEHHGAKPDRCGGIEFDAIAPDEKGITFFFKGGYVWKGFQGPPQLLNNSFKEVGDHHHLGHVDAGFRMHNQDDPTDHDHIFLFLNQKVFSYYNHTLEKGFPKEIQQVFPNIPGYLDAAVECPKGECVTDSVIFFKGEDVYHYDIKTKTVKHKVWSHLPKCTSAFRWLERHYCFHGNQFTKFHPVTGEVVGDYPKDARSYFMRCPGFGHGQRNATVKMNCTDVRLDAVTADDAGKAYAFRGELFMRLDSRRDGWHAFPIVNAWKEVQGNVDAVFFFNENLYFLKGDQVYIYKSGAHYTLIEGYPKPLKEELGIEGVVDAAFMCKGKHTLYVIQGQKMKFLDLTASPRVVEKEALLPIAKVDAAACGPDGVKVFSGSDFYSYDSPTTLAFSQIKVAPEKIPLQMLGSWTPGSVAGECPIERISSAFPIPPLRPPLILLLIILYKGLPGTLQATLAGSLL
ncbi:hemopexin-like [Arapaima gigas]